MTSTDQSPVRVFEDGTEEIRLSIHETLVTPISDEVLKHHLAGSQIRHSWSSGTSSCRPFTGPAPSWP